MPSLENLHAGEVMNTQDPNQYKEKALPKRAAPHPDWNDRLLDMARGKLSGAELSKTQEHLDQCPTCRAAYEDYQEIIDMIGDEVEAHLLAELAQLEAPPGLPPHLRQTLADYTAGRPIHKVKPRIDPPKLLVGSGLSQRAEHGPQERAPVAHTPGTTRPGATLILALAPALPRLAVNATLGEYRVMSDEGLVGPFQRYMGEPKLHPTPVELHVLPTRLSPQGREPFNNAVRNLQRLKHPAIVPLIDFGIEKRVPYLVFGYTPAETLRQKHSSDLPLAPETVVSYVQQIAAALTYAHNWGIIHGNIRPEHLLLGSGGIVRVANFDLSPSILSTDAQASDEAPLPLYTAPEQFTGESGPASDQYALAAVAYEWLTGSPPFRGATFAEVAERQQQDKPIPPRRKRPMLPLDLDRVMLKALSKHPAERYPTVEAFALALAQSIPDPAVEAARVAESIEEYASLEPPSDPEKANPGATTVIYDGHSGPVLAVAWSTHGHHIASGGADGTIQVWDAQRGKEVNRYSYHKEEITALSWAPGKDLLASASNDGDVHIWKPGSGKSATIYTGYPKPLTTVAWSPNNEFLACGRDDHTVHVWRAGETQPLVIYAGHARPVSGLVWSPDGKRIASADSGGTVHVWEVDATTKQTIVTYREHKKSVLALAWSPNGSRIASGGDDKRIRIWQAGNGANILSYTGHTSTVSALDWSPDGRYVASGDHQGALHVWAAHTGKPFMTLPKAHTNRITGLAWSPAHTNLLASSSFDGTAIRWEIRPLQV